MIGPKVTNAPNRITSPMVQFLTLPGLPEPTSII